MNAEFRQWLQQTKTTHCAAELRKLMMSFANNGSNEGAKAEIEQGIGLLLQVAKGTGVIDNSVYTPNIDAYDYCMLKAKNSVIEDQLYKIREMRKYTILLINYFEEEGDSRVRKGFDLIMKGIKQLETSLFISYESKQ